MSYYCYCYCYCCIIISFLLPSLLPMHLFTLHVTANNLGPPSPSPPPAAPKTTSKKNTTTLTLPIIASVAATSFLLLSITLFLIFRCVRKPKRNRSHFQPSSSNNTCRHFSIAEIRSATNNFDDSLIIGNGGFGNVYKGHMDTCHSPVAIKRLKQDSEQGALEFQTEITTLSQLRHPHLVSLIGYCNDGHEMVLVYDFMARGTLREHLYGPEDQNHRPSLLPWTQRLEICLAAARGLQFLHGGGNRPSVIHRDVKSTNILLDEKWVAKVSDFGLSKVKGLNGSHVTTDVKGSLGYLDPEYYMSLWLTHKSDVYSFGVVLLEVLCGRAPIKRRVERQEECLVVWVKKCYREGTVHLTVDPAVRGTIRPKCLDKFVKIALSCLRDHGKERPLMRDVVKGLECALRLQQHSGSRGGSLVREKGKEEEMMISTSVVGGSHGEYDDHKFGPGGVSQSSGSKATTTSEEEQALVHGDFSQLRNPTPR